MGTPRSCTQISFGTQRSQLRAGDFLVTESEYVPGLETTAHAHTSTSLVFGLAGALEQTHGGRPQQLGPRSLLVLPRGAVHSDRVGAAGCRCLFVTLQQAHLDEVGRASRVLAVPSITTGGYPALLGAALHRESRVRDSARALAIEGLVFSLLATLVRQREPSTERGAAWLEQVRDRLADEFASPPGAAELAAEAGVDASYLVRAFARRYGETMGNFVRRQRLEWAMDALLTSGEPIAGIAMAAGYFDQSHFTRQFRRQVGTTPARFRRERVVSLRGKLPPIHRDRRASE